MKKCMFIFIGLFSSLTAICQNQAQLNREAEMNLQKYELELKDIYSRIISNHKSNTEFIANLKAAQDSWLVYRDAQIQLKFPNKKPGYYGSSFLMCLSFYKNELTQVRIKELRQWLILEEGDVCAGSISQN